MGSGTWRKSMEQGKVVLGEALGAFLPKGRKLDTAVRWRVLDVSLLDLSQAPSAWLSAPLIQAFDIGFQA